MGSMMWQDVVRSVPDDMEFNTVSQTSRSMRVACLRNLSIVSVGAPQWMKCFSCSEASEDMVIGCVWDCQVALRVESPLLHVSGHRSAPPE